MTEKNLGTSQQVLVLSVEENGVHPRKLPQYFACLVAALGAVSAGLVIGWTSSAGDNGAELKYPFEIDSNDFSWLSSIITLGGAASSIPAGMLIDVIGRRKTMLIGTLPYTIGWACVIWPNSVGTLIFGRFALGFGISIFFVCLPIYLCETADKETRGKIGSFVELNSTIGIFMAYTLGLLHNMFLLSIISAAVPLIFCATFYFMPETPTYNLMKGNVDSARKTLIWLRGSHYDVESELNEKLHALAEAEQNKISFFVAIRSRATLKGLLIAFGLMFFQQLSGISAIIFYCNALFAEITGEVSDWPTIIVGALQVLAVMMSIQFVDSWGRKIPLFVSGAVMCIASLVLGVYLDLKINESISVENLWWLPLVCICGFVLAFEFGFGPVPWLITGEIFAPQIKGVAGSCVSIFGSLMTFIVTKCYVDVKNKIGVHSTFWIFSAICGLNIVFVFFAVPQTKGMTLEQIQIELGGLQPNTKKQGTTVLGGNIDLAVKSK